MSIYAKKQDLEAHKRKVGALDQRFMKRAEDLLFGELAAALDIPREEVPGYIARRVEGQAPLRLIGTYTAPPAAEAAGGAVSV